MPNNGGIVSRSNNTQSSTYIGNLGTSNITGLGTITYTYDDYDPATTEAASYTYDLATGAFTYPNGAGKYVVTSSTSTFEFVNGTSALNIPIYIFATYDATAVANEGSFGISSPEELAMFSDLVDSGNLKINAHLNNDIDLAMYAN